MKTLKHNLVQFLNKIPIFLYILSFILVYIIIICICLLTPILPIAAILMLLIKKK
jgi:hypothetical protein